MLERGDSYDEVYDAFGDSTTLFITLRDGWSDDDAVLGQGIIHVRIPDLIKQTASIRARNNATTAAGARWHDHRPGGCHPVLFRATRHGVVEDARPYGLHPAQCRRDRRGGHDGDR